MSWFSNIGNFISDGFNAGTSAFDDGLRGNTNESLSDLWGPVSNSLPAGWGDEVQNNVLNPVSNFIDDQYDAFGSHLKDIGNGIKADPVRFLTAGIDPLSTGLYNAVTGSHDKPLTDQWGGMTKDEWQNAANRGVNTENAGYMSTLAHMVAAYYGGQALAGLGGLAYTAAYGGGAGSAVDAAGGAGGMGSSALDVQAEMAAPAGVAGSGSSAAGWASQGLDAMGGATAAGANASAGAARGAGVGVANAEDNGTNPWTAGFQGALTGGIGSGMDLAGYAGVDNPYLKSGINGGINGGLRAGMQDPSQTGYGALVGSLQGLVGKGANALGSYLTQPTSGDAGSSGTTNWGNLATGLGNLYLSSRNNAGIQGQINGLQSLYAPNSPYAQQMQQSLDRQDAAGGRRSQYGTRAVELQAQLANAASRNAPTLANLYAQQRQNRFSQYAGLLGTARNSGVFNGLGGMFQQGGGAGPAPSTVQAGPSDYQSYDPTQMNSNVMSTVPAQLDPNQIYGG